MDTEHTVQKSDKQLVAFLGDALIVRGTVDEVAPSARRFFERAAPDGPRLAIYDDQTGGPIDVDFGGTDAEIVARLRHELGLPGPGHRAAGADGSPTDATTHSAPVKRGRGRPKLGVVSREVSLLPRHWEWLSDQRGGASATLRRLVETARKQSKAGNAQRLAIDSAHKFMWDIAGDAPGFEEASRALYAADFEAFETRIEGFSPGIRAQLLRMVDRARTPQL